MASIYRRPGFNQEEDPNLERMPGQISPPPMSMPSEFNRLAVEPQMSNPIEMARRGFTPGPENINPPMSSPIQMNQSPLSGFKIPGQMGLLSNPSPLSGMKSLSSAPSPINPSPIAPMKSPQTQIAPPISNPINPSPMRPPMNVPGNPRINPGMRPMKPRMRGPIQSKRTPFSTF